MPGKTVHTKDYLLYVYIFFLSFIKHTHRLACNQSVDNYSRDDVSMKIVPSRVSIRPEQFIPGLLQCLGSGLSLTRSSFEHLEKNNRPDKITDTFLSRYIYLIIIIKIFE